MWKYRCVLVSACILTGIHKDTEDRNAEIVRSRVRTDCQPRSTSASQMIACGEQRHPLSSPFAAKIKSILFWAH